MKQNTNQRIKDKKIVNDVDYRWELIDKLVEKYGSDYDKLAWALCRGDAAEWRVGNQLYDLEEVNWDV